MLMSRSRYRRPWSKYHYISREIILDVFQPIRTSRRVARQKLAHESTRLTLLVALMQTVSLFPNLFHVIFQVMPCDLVRHLSAIFLSLCFYLVRHIQVLQIQHHLHN